MKPIHAILSLLLTGILGCTPEPGEPERFRSGYTEIEFEQPAPADSLQALTARVQGEVKRRDKGILVELEISDPERFSDTSRKYNSDMVELYFDFRPYHLRTRNFYERGVFQVLLKPSFHAAAPDSASYFPGTYPARVPGTKYRSELTDDGYRISYFMPLEGLEEVHYLPRKRFYMDVGVFNAAAGREPAHFFWKGNDMNWKEPHHFAEVRIDTPDHATGRPNVVLIFTDQQTLGAMSAYGNPYLQTPHMDKLAKFGVRFTNSYCTAPVCSPSRSTIVTGRMPHETGVNYNNMAIDSAITNVGELLTAGGYHTTWSGKWHLPHSYPHARGADTLEGFRLVDFLEADRMSGLGGVTDGPLADRVSEMIREGMEEPFFLGVSLHNPHDICYVPSEPARYPPPPNIEAAPPLPDNFEDDPGEPEFLYDCRQRTYYGAELHKTKDYSREDWRNYIYHYYRFTEAVDAEVGKVITALEQAGYSENTLIIFTSDHGDGAGSHRWAVKLSLYEEPVTVPLVVTWFGHTPENEVRTQLVSGLDLVPTILDYAGVSADVTLHGKSLRPVIEDASGDLHEYVVSELSPDPKNPDRMARMIRTQKYKYILYSYGQRNEQLFDLEKDPGETRNLAYLPWKRRVVEQHRTLLREWLEKTGDPFLEYMKE